MPRSVRVLLSFAILGLSTVAPGTTAARAAGPAVAATVETTLGTGSGQIRQFAFDGDPDSYFASKGNADASDHFTLVFDEPVAVTSVAVMTGRPGGGDALDAGTLEVSPDGKTFDTLAKFADGSARGVPKGRAIQAIRVRAGERQAHPLAIREVTVASEPPVATFAYPVEFIVDVSDAPEMKAWADKVARICERAYPMINEELKSDGYKPPHLIRMTLDKDYDGVAAASGDRITGSVAFFRDHPDDVGAMVHETAHVVQQYRARNLPGWLVEGVADYVRFFKYEPENLGPIDPARSHYDGSYRVSAAFLAYLAKTYDKDIVLKLNETMRNGRYKEDLFEQLTGKAPRQLDEEWRATLQR